MESEHSLAKRYAACIEYCGCNYAGWQRQKHCPSVQQEVEKAISKVANHDVSIVTAGRTDTGVHGIGQVIHFDTPSQREPFNWIRGVNTTLPNDISLMWTHPVSADFHARFSARQRHYRYVIFQREVSPSYLHGRVTWHRRKLNLQKMQQASEALLGRHDFSAFRAAGCQSKNPVRQIIKLEISQNGPWFWLDICADGFLQHMVRNIVGVLCRIGCGDAPADWAREVLLSRDRTKAGLTSPPDGLYFARVDYDAEFGLPAAPPVCQFW